LNKGTLEDTIDGIEELGGTGGGAKRPLGDKDMGGGGDLDLHFAYATDRVKDL